MLLKAYIVYFYFNDLGFNNIFFIMIWSYGINYTYILSKLSG